MKTLATILLSLIISLSYAQNKKLEFTENTDLMTYLDLSMEEEDIINEINVLNKEAKVSTLEQHYISERVEELKAIIKLSANMESINTKARRKLQDYRSDILILESSAQELNSMSNQLAFNIYKAHLKKPVFRKKTKQSKAAKAYLFQADSLFKFAEKSLLLAELEETDEAFIIKLRTINENYKSAVMNQRKALALHLNKELPAEKTVKVLNQELVIEQQTAHLMKQELDEEIAEEKRLASLSNQIPTNNKISSIDSEEDVAERAETFFNSKEASSIDLEDNKSLSKDLVFRVQVGAFLNEVSKASFAGLSPIYIEESADDFSRAFVGHHHTYRSAEMALEIVRKTTKHKDAFIVAYYNGERRMVSEIAALLSKENGDDVIATNK